MNEETRIAVGLLLTTDMTYTDIGRKVGRSGGWVRKRDDEFRCRPRPERPSIADENANFDRRVKAALQEIREGAGIAASARKHGLTYGCVASKCHRQGIRAREGIRTFYIYGLACPLTGQLFYVGASKNPWRRIYGHVKQPVSAAMAGWLSALKRRGLSPHLKVLAKLTVPDWRAVERKWIAKMVRQGHPVMNREGCE